MKTDHEVRRMVNERRKGKTQEQAAARASMSVRTARKAVHLCFSESFEALAEGLESCLWQLGGVPEQHRTDNLSAAVVRIERGGERHYTERVPGADRPLPHAALHQQSR